LLHAGQSKAIETYQNFPRKIESIISAQHGFFWLELFRRIQNIHIQGVNERFDRKFESDLGISAMLLG
jgi:hypothetical protein